jgi:hypothetical protein
MIRSPFKFLDSYTFADKDIFFGREAEIEEVYSRFFYSNLLPHQFKIHIRKEGMKLHSGSFFNQLIINYSPVRDKIFIEHGNHRQV